jgi:hypothetical protein
MGIPLESLIVSVYVCVVLAKCGFLKGKLKFAIKQKHKRVLRTGWVQELGSFIFLVRKTQRTSQNSEGLLNHNAVNR